MISQRPEQFQIVVFMGRAGRKALQAVQLATPTLTEGSLLANLNVPAVLDQGKAVHASRTPIWQQATVCTPSGVATVTAQ